MSLWRWCAVSPMAILAHSWVTVQPLERGTRSMCWPVSHNSHSHVESVIPQLHLDSHRSLSFPGSCGANLLHGISHGMAWLGLAQQGHGGTGRACFVPWSRAAASVCFVVYWKLVFLCAQGFLWLPGGMLGLGGGFCSWKCCMITTLVFGNLLEFPVGISISIWCHRWRLLPRSGNNIS